MLWVRILQEALRGAPPATLPHNLRRPHELTTEVQLGQSENHQKPKVRIKKKDSSLKTKTTDTRHKIIRPEDSYTLRETEKTTLKNGMRGVTRESMEN